MLASSKGHIAIIRELLRAGARVNLQDDVRPYIMSFDYFPDHHNRICMRMLKVSFMYSLTQVEDPAGPRFMLELALSLNFVS